METELQLLTLVRDGDRQAMRRLYDRFAGVATAIALRYVGRGDACRDVVQEGFLKVYAQIARFDYRGEGSLRSWLGRIMSNAAVDYLRTERRLTFTSDLPDPPDEEPDVGRVSDEVLFDMISRLPDGCRTVLNLHVFEQLSHKEIAQRLGIRPDTSASQFFYAKKLLSKMIKQREKE